MLSKGCSLLKRGVNDPHKTVRSFHQKFQTIDLEVASLYNKVALDDEICDIINEDWDNLIILDACRYDFFAEQNNIDGELKRKVSSGSDSWGFMKHNFEGRKLHDTVYITSNPHVDRLSDGVFFKIENTLDEWDSTIEVVHPETMVKTAKKAHKSHPNKRLIVHFMQPHTPWLGPTADGIRAKYNVKGNNKNHGKAKLGIETEDPRSGDVGWFELVKRGDVNHDKMRQAYCETLNFVLDYTDELIKSLPGKSVVTSDHGEMLGERLGVRRRYGHFSANYWTEELRYVPWLEISSDNRRKLVESEPKENSQMDSDIIEDRLQALGYK